MPSPHDALFKRMFADLQHAGPLLRALLSPELVAAIDWNQLAPLPDTRVDEEQNEEHRDLVFRTRIGNRPLLLYLVLEHKSQPDRWTVLQVLAYQVGIWRDAHLQRPRPKHLPLVVPVVVHCGRRPWTATTDLWSLFDTRDVPHEVAALLRRTVPTYAIEPHDFATRSAADLRNMALSLHGLWTIVCMQFLARAGADERAFVAALREWADIGRRLVQDPIGQSALRTLQSYILRITALPRPRLSALIEQELGAETMKKFVSTWDQMMREGEAKGRAEALLRLLDRRFGALPPTVHARIAAAAIDDIDRWTLRILDAGSLDEVFAPA